MNHPALHVSYCWKKIQQPTDLFGNNKREKYVRSSMAMVLSVVMDEDLSTAEELSLESSVEERRLKEPMWCSPLSLFRSILVICFVQRYIQRQWFWKTSCHCAWDAVHSDELLWLCCLPLAGVFPPWHWCLAVFLPSMCLEYISGCKASDTPACENFAVNLFVIGFVDFNQRHWRTIVHVMNLPQRIDSNKMPMEFIFV